MSDKSPHLSNKSVYVITAIFVLAVVSPIVWIGFDVGESREPAKTVNVFMMSTSEYGEHLANKLKEEYPQATYEDMAQIRHTATSTGTAKDDVEKAYSRTVFKYKYPAPVAQHVTE